MSCKQEKTAQETNAQGDWITGTEQEKIQTIESQFRGFDMAMVETGYRYIELYWAGKDKNWDYASYQVDKINKTIQNGLIRRPKRSKSAQYFLNESLPNMKSAIELEDTSIFQESFKQLTIDCNNCHIAENLSFFSVKTPLNRQSAIAN